MINIIQDPNKLYTQEADIIVDDVNTYVKSRLLINQVKSGIKDNITIVIVRPMYFKYYKDLYSMPSWLSIKEFTLNNIIERYGLNFSEVEINRIVTLVDREDIVSFLADYEKDSNLDFNLLKFLFYNGEKIVDIDRNEELLLWIEESIQKKRIEWTDIKYKEFLKKSIKSELRGEFFDQVITISSLEDIKIFKKSLIATYLFLNYPSSSRNTINPKINISNKNYLSEEYIRTIIMDMPSLIEDLDSTISIIKDKLSIFDNDDLDYFLKTTTGHLREEWVWVWDYLSKNFMDKDFYDDLSKVYTWTKLKSGKNKVRILLELKLFNDEKEGLKSPENIHEWYDYYQYFYLKWFSALDEGKNIIGLLTSLNEEFLDTTIKEINEYKNSINNKYKDFLYINYSDLMRQGETNIKVLESLNQYVYNTKALFFIIDGCTWEVWEKIKSIFEEHQYYIENIKQACLSAIPSITNISRTSLVTGKTFQTIVKEKVNNEFSFDILNEEKHIKSIYPNKNVSYGKGEFNELEDLLKSISDIYVFVYTGYDYLFHSYKNMTIGSMEPLLKELINRLINKIKEDDLIIIFGTDHGATTINDKVKILLDLKVDINIEQCGNSLKLFSEFFDDGDLNELKEQISNDDFYSIWREDLYKFGLPKRVNNQEVYGWLFPKSSSYYGRKAKGFNHGGFSMEETIIPYGIFRRQQVSFKKMKVEIFSRGLSVNNSSYIDMIIYNPNNFTIKKVIIESDNLAIREITNDILARDKRRISLKFLLNQNLCKGGYLKSKISFTIYYLNNVFEQNLQISEKVTMKASDKISEDVSSKRTLDF